MAQVADSASIAISDRTLAIDYGSPQRLSGSAPRASTQHERPAPALLSPVNERGHFEFDRVIKAGEVLKRTRKTKHWRTVYLVLRPLQLSIYRNPDETKLRHTVNLSDLTAVARQRDPRKRAQYVFGLFSPSKNYHLAAKDDKEAQSWVEMIRREAKMDEDEEELNMLSSGEPDTDYIGFSRAINHNSQGASPDAAGLSSSDAEMPPMSPVPKTRTRKASTVLEYSGAENASYSDFSDAAGHVTRVSVRPNHRQGPSQGATEDAQAGARDAEDMTAEELEARATVAELQAAARIICQGWILLLKSHSGVKAWKKTWMVLRARSLAMYKNEKEYSALRVIPCGSIVDAVEIDPISSSKHFCMQVITDEKGYRFCARDEEDLSQWLSAFKTLLATRKEHKS